VKLILCAAVLAAATMIAPALADPPAPVPPYVDTTCGTWVNDEWVPSGKCPPDDEHLRHDTVSGTITIVKGHLVTIQQSHGTVVINDQPALDSKQTGKVAVGRMVVAYGYWSDNNFYATAIY
jgi:hypothetical protein